MALWAMLAGTTVAACNTAISYYMMPSWWDAPDYEHTDSVEPETTPADMPHDLLEDEAEDIEEEEELDVEEETEDVEGEG